MAVIYGCLWTGAGKSQEGVLIMLSSESGYYVVDLRKVIRVISGGIPILPA